ncbi:MAG TPA: cardiolipin synthase ClsB [Burkholderiaceae bacterium]|nr:cardiolipin synthase ClsB [Burkholderiaceae bacterium]
MSHAAPPLRDGHQIALLQGSQEFFDALIKAMDRAKHEVRLETYIFDFTASGADVAHALMRAARRGVATLIIVDGLGTGKLPAQWEQRFVEAGVQWRVYAPSSTLGLLIPGRWRRLHRKLCVIDGQVAFCGGINILDDFHDPNHGVLKSPRFDFAMRVCGPLAADAQNTMAQLWLRMAAVRSLKKRQLSAAVDSFRAAGREPPPTAPMPLERAERPHFVRAALVLRDNIRHRARIERAYRKAISTARHEIIIANAYFVPGRKMRRALEKAAQGGVRVLLLLQGRYEYFMQYYASRPVYGALLRAGVEIHEYSPSFLHAKVAVVDGRWATVGSSNLDPLSMLLAREANVMVEDAAFAADLRERLMRAIHEGGQQMDAAQFENRSLGERFKERVALILMRLALMLHGKEYL